MGSPAADHPDPAAPLRRGHPARFLEARVGDTVVVGEPRRPWWIGVVIHCEGGARSGAVSFVQAACVDSGVVRTLSADSIVEILHNEQ